jgi:ribosomal protein L31
MNASLLRQAVGALQQHSEQDRIKKLIHWVCEQGWPRSAADAKDLEALLPKLLRLAASQSGVQHENPVEILQAETCAFSAALQSVLMQGASTLSKRQKYTEVALAICQNLAPFYTSGGSSNGFGREQSAVDVFELRLAVMKYTIPLNAKILIYSALNQVVTGQRQDWISLRQVALDELLLNLCQTYPTFVSLEKRLWQTVDEVQLLDQPTQTLQALLQAVKPFYAQSSVFVGNAMAASVPLGRLQGLAPSLEIGSSETVTSPTRLLEDEERTTLHPVLKNSDCRAQMMLTPAPQS